jgi:hypothetical protein
MDILIIIAKVDLMLRVDALASVAKNIDRSMSRFIALFGLLYHLCTLNSCPTGMFHTVTLLVRDY